MTCVQITNTQYAKANEWLKTSNHYVDYRDLTAPDIVVAPSSARGPLGIIKKVTFLIQEFPIAIDCDPDGTMHIGFRTYSVPHLNFANEDDAAMFLLKFGGAVVQ